MDVDRIKDVELLRTVTKVQDHEIRRLHVKLREATRIAAEARGATSTQIEEQLRLLQEQLDEQYRKAYSTGSERRPSGREKTDEPKQPQKGHGPTPQPELPLEIVDHHLDEADQVARAVGADLPSGKVSTTKARRSKSSKSSSYDASTGVTSTSADVATWTRRSASTRLFPAVVTA